MTEKRPLPKHYLRHAAETNRAAGFLLVPQDQPLNSSSAAISIGLSLHSMELCGKSMLRSLGYRTGQIYQRHRQHRLLDLLGDVESEISQHSDPEVQKFRNFLLYTPTIDGQEFGNTVAAYLKRHFSQGRTAYPRSYLYPDNATFTGPQPISALHVMAEYLVEKAKEFAEALNYESL